METDTALACLHRYGGVRFEPCAGCEVDNLRAQLEDAKDGAEVLHEEIAKYRTQLATQSQEIARLRERVEKLVEACHSAEYNREGASDCPCCSNNAHLFDEITGALAEYRKARP